MAVSTAQYKKAEATGLEVECTKDDLKMMVSVPVPVPVPALRRTFLCSTGTASCAGLDISSGLVLSASDWSLVWLTWPRILIGSTGARPLRRGRRQQRLLRFNTGERHDCDGIP